MQALNASVSYAEGTVGGPVQTDVCAEPGDSGDCSSGGQTFFQSVTEALEVYGATLP